jgi:hypothetical protein
MSITTTMHSPATATTGKGTFAASLVADARLQSRAHLPHRLYQVNSLTPDERGRISVCLARGEGPAESPTLKTRQAFREEGSEADISTGFLSLRMSMVNWADSEQ